MGGDMSVGTSRAFAITPLNRRISAKAAPLLSSAALIPVISAVIAGSVLIMPGVAFAQAAGGNGGGGGGAGGLANTTAGGTGEAGGSGVAAGSGGGGGGAGENGGAGGTGSGGTAGGPGSSSILQSGQNGSNATLSGNGGGGGGGGAASIGSSTSTSFNSSLFLSGGGAGGAGLGSGSGGGGGGGGFIARTVSSSASVDANVVVVGGAGGFGGAGGATGNGGDGGNGGTAFIVNGTAATTIQSGAALLGGAGGNGGTGVLNGRGGDGGAGLNQTNGSVTNLSTIRGGTGGTGSVAGAGGVGLIGTDVTISNIGSIIGGLSGTGQQAFALQLSGASAITNIGTLTGGVEIASGTTTFDLATNQTLANIISGAGALTKSGAGTLTLSGANTYAGLTTVSAGTLIIGNNTALGITAAGTTVESGAALVLQGPSSSLNVDEALTLSGTGVGGTGAVRSTSNFNTLLGAITLASDVRIEADATGGLDIRSTVSGDGRTVTFGGSGTITMQGAGSLALGSGSVVKEGTGILGLFRTNTYTGDTHIKSGFLQFAGGSALSDTGRLILDAGTVGQSISNTETIGSLSGSGTLRLQSGGTIIVGDDSSTTFSGNIILFSDGTGGLTKRGSGTLTLSGANTYAGLTTVSAGTLRAAGATALGSTAAGTTVESGATVEIEGDISVAEAFSIAGNGVANNGAIRFLSGIPTLSGAITLTADARINSDSSSGFAGISGGITGNNFNLTLGGSGLLRVNSVIDIGTGGLTKDGAGTLLLSRSNTYTGLTRILAGALSITNQNALGDSSSGTTIEDGGMLFLDGTTGDIRLSEALTLNGAGPADFGALRSAGSNNFLNSTTTLASNSRIEVGSSLLVFTAPITSAGTGTGQTLSFGGPGNVSVVAAVALGTGGLIKEGTGTVSLQRANSYTGDTQVRDGVLEISSSGLGLSDTGLLTIETGAAVHLIGAIQETFGSLSGGGNLQLFGANQNGSGIRFGDASNTTFSGVISSDSAIARIDKRGTGTVILTGANTYAGTTRIIEGTIQLGNGGTTGSLGGGEIENFGALVVNRSNDLTLANLISGTGTLTKEGTGILTLTGTNTFTGGIDLAGGTLRLGSSQASGGLGSVIRTTGSVIDYADNINNGAGIEINSNTTQLQVLTGSAFQSGVISEINGPRGFEKIGAGTLSLTRPNSFTGDTLISAGELQVTGGQALSDTGRVTIESGAMLRVAVFSQERIGSLAGSGQLRFEAGGSVIVGDASDTTFSGVISQGGPRDGDFIKRGTGNLTLSGANTYETDTRIEAGTLTITNASGLGSTFGATTVIDGATLAISGTNLQINEALTLSGTGVAGAGALTTGGFVVLNGAITLTGDTLINGGTARLSLLRDITGDGHTLTLSSTNEFVLVEGAINTGTGGLIKNGNGSVTLFGSNSFTGNVAINDGSLSVGMGASNTIADTALVTIASGASFFTAASERIGNISGAGSVGVGSGTTLTVGDATDQTHSGSLFVNGLASSTLVKEGSGRLTLGTQFGFDGQINVNAGTLQFGTGGFGGVVGSTSLTTLMSIAEGATVVFNRSANQTINRTLTGAGTIRQIGTGATTLAGNISGYTGAAFVEAGALRVTGNFGGTVEVGGSGTLGGTGTITGAVTINSGGTLAAGLSPGTLTVGSLTLNTGSITNFELGTPGLAGGPNNDLMRVTGNLALNGGTINVARGTGFARGTYTLFEFGTLSGAINNMTLSPLSGAFLGTLALSGRTVVLNTVSAGDLIFWNGTTTAPTGAVVGGSGTWNLTNSNFTDQDGGFSSAWAGNGFQAVFAGATGGTVTIAPGVTLAPTGLAFRTNGYVIAGGDAASGLAFSGPTGIDTASGVGATISAAISGTGSVAKTGTGTLTLSGTNTYGGSTTVLGGTLVNSGTIAGAVANNATLTSTGRLLGGLANNAGAQANLAGTANGTISNAGTITVTGNLASNAALSNDQTGLVTVNSGATWSGLTFVSNSGTTANAFTVNGSLLVSGNFINASNSRLTIGSGGSVLTIPAINQAGILNATGALITNAGTINNIVDNSGTVNSTGNLQGLLNNNFGASATLSGAVAQVSNAALITVNGNLATTGAVTNIGTGRLTVNAGAAWTGIASVLNSSTAPNAFTINGSLGTNGAFSNNANAQLTIGATGTLTAATGITNAGSLTSTGTINGTLTNATGGAVNLAGALNGAVSNSGAITLTGATTGIGAFSQMAAGSFALGGFSTSIGSLAGDGMVSLGAATLTIGSNGTSTSFGGVISGNGGLTKAGAGTFTLTGVNSYAGETRINQGGLILAAGGVIAGQVNNSGSFTNSGTVTGQVSNASDFASSGTVQGGLMQLSGTSTLSGILNGPISSAGTLIVDANLTSNGFAQTSGAGLTQVLGDARWSGLSGFSHASTNATGLVIAGALDVSGNFTTQAGATTIIGGGTGTLTATGITNFGTITNNGTVNSAVTNGGTSAGTITNNFIWNGGLVQGAGSATNAFRWNGFFRVGSAGTITNNGAWDNVTGVMSEVTDGLFQNVGTLTGGGVNVSGATAVLANLAGGAITLADGALLRADSGGTITNAGAITANAQVNAGGVARNLAGGTWSGPLAIAANGSLTNAGMITGTVTNTGSFTSTGTLSGALVNNASGTATLAGALNGTVSNSGAITLTGITTGIDDLSQDTNGTLDLGGFATMLGSLAGSGTITLGTANITVGGNATSTRFDGVITGTGGLSKTGGGTLVLGGANRYTGTNTIGAGTLSLASGGALAGAVANNAAFGNAGTVGGLVTNNGTLASTGALNGGLVNASGASATLAGVVSGSFSNAGTVMVASGTTLAASPLANAGQVQNAGAWTGDVTNSAGAMFENTATGSLTGVFDNRGTLLSAGTITGRLTNSGGAQLAGTLVGPIVNSGEVLTNGNLSHTGEVTNSGMFMVGAGTFTTSGTFTNNGSLLVNSGATMALGTSTQGTSTLGTATLGNSGTAALIDVAGTLRGRIDLASGTLIGRAGSLLAGDVVIASGATFMSGGTVTGSATINGTLLPGNSPGTLTVNGTLALGSSSTTVFEMTNAVSDQIIVNGAATIASGATLVLTGVREATPGQSYSLISTTGGITGSFTNVVKDRSVFGFIRQDADSIDLLGTLTLPTGISGQGAATVNYLNERLLTGTVSDAGLALTPAFAALDGSAVLPVVARLSPEPYASAATMALENGLVLAKTVRAVAVAGADEDNGGLFVFGQGFAAGRDMAARPIGTAPAAQAGEGFLGGIGYGTSALGLSAFVGRSSVRQEIADLGAQTRARGTFFGAKAQVAAGALRFTAAAIFDRSDADTNRAPVSGAAQGRYTLHGETYDAQLAFDLPIGSGGLHLRPSAGVTHSRVTRGAVAETGGGAAALSVVRQSYQATWINGDLALHASTTSAIQPWVGAGVRHLASGDPIRATGTLAGFGGQFTIDGAQALRTFAHASGGVSANLAPGLSAYLTGEVDIAPKGGARQVQGGIRYAF